MSRPEIMDLRWLAKAYGLTKREIEIAVHILKGRTSRQIARELEISYATVLAHRANLRRKMGINNTAGLFVIVANHPRPGSE
jgi:DNA-binding CsgD family transcriptional regulator